MNNRVFFVPIKITVFACFKKLFINHSFKYIIALPMYCFVAGHQYQRTQITFKNVKHCFKDSIKPSFDLNLFNMNISIVCCFIFFSIVIGLKCFQIQLQCLFYTYFDINGAVIFIRSIMVVMTFTIFSPYLLLNCY